LLAGEVDFNVSSEIAAWSSTTITRNYNVIAKNVDGDPIGNVRLSLYDQNNTLIWNGTTENSGKADFNITFTDGNYTESLKLKVLKDGFYNMTEHVEFLSSTPVSVSLIRKPLGDVNEDHAVNIVDVSLVARSYGCEPRDEKWNGACDLNQDGVINILDISLVAKDYGKTV
jgi:hypothetical protein